MIGEDSTLSAVERQYLDDAIETLRTEVFVDDLDEDHFRDLDQNEESHADWQEFVRRLGERDFLGISVPVEHNGGGDGFVETVLAEQALGYVGCIVHACQASLTQHIGRTMYEHGDDHIRESYLEPMLAGDRIVAQAFTEPSSGTDMAHLGTTAEREGEEYIISGEKRFVDFATYADLFVVPVRTGGAPGDRNGLSIFVVDGDADGIEIRDDLSDWHGFRGTGASWVRFDDVRVQAANRIGEGDAAWAYLTNELNLEHLTIARYCLGASERALEIAANYTEAREVNERPLSRYQGVTHQLAEASTKLDAAYLLNTRAARLLDEGGMDSGRMESAMAKQFGNDAAHEIADVSMQVMGGVGTTTYYPVERTVRDVRAGRYLGGASEVMKSIVQHDAYDRLGDEGFDQDRVGHEVDGLPWTEQR